MPTRRALLASAAALPAAAALQSLAATQTLSAREAEVQLVPEGYPRTSLWTFDGTAPGPLLRARQGEELTVTVHNELQVPTSVHWHGLRLDNAMDGVPYLTQAPILPGATFDYRLRLPDAGTFWYHSHSRSFEQVARGLYGPLIVDEPSPPRVDADHVLMLDDWRLDREAAIADGFANMHDMSHVGRLGNWLTVNGNGEPAFPVARNARLRLRLVNAANGRIFQLSAQGLTGWVIALDGAPLAAPEPLEGVVLAPAQRADLLVDVVPDGEEALLISHDRDGTYALASFPVDDFARPAPLAPPKPLPANPIAPLPDLAGIAPIELVMQGGAMGRLVAATHEGEELAIRELVRRGQAWAFSGVAGMPYAPLVDVPRGTALRLRLVNDTAWPHGIHVHGHHFRRIDGATGAWRDTLLVERQQSAEIAFVADNPGDWLIHCHMLEHAASGMMTWFRVT